MTSLRAAETCCEATFVAQISPKPSCYWCPHLVMGRVIGRALITLHRAKLVAGNTRYILRNTEQGWAQLSWFLSRTADEVSASLASTQ